LVLSGGLLVRATGQDAPKAGSDDEKASLKALRARWVRLHAEFVTFATPIVEGLGPSNRAPGEGSRELTMRTKNAEAAYQNAKFAREVAEIDVTTYVEGIAKQELETAQGEINLAEEALKRAEGRLERARAAQKKINDILNAKTVDLSAAEILARLNIERTCEDEERELRRARFEREMAQSRMTALTKYGQNKRKLELRADVEQKKAQELARNADWEFARSNELRAERGAGGARLTRNQRKVLTLLAEAASMRGILPPSGGAPSADPARMADSLKEYLDRFEAKLAEARKAQAEAANDSGMDRFQALRERIIQEVGEPGQP
jgi:hypothetical protein